MEEKDSWAFKTAEMLLADGGGRYIRGFFYFILAFFLIRANTYGLTHSLSISIMIGFMGMGAKAAQIGRIAIAILVLMAVLPLPAIEAIRSALV